MTAADRFLCAEAARARGDALAGTAPYGVVWILIEYRDGWPPNGFDGLALDPVTKARVYAAAQALRARVLLVRRHGRGVPEGPRRWAVLRHHRQGAHRQQWGTWSRDTDLAGIVDALDAPGEPGHPPVVLVCAHGLHDVCCAVRGRPVGRALNEHWPDLVWECTHVAGDRFAANVVIAPDGVYYGNLDAATSVTAVRQHLAGRIHADHLRGYTDLVPPEQAAVAAVLARFGPAERHAYTTRTTRLERDRWNVRVAGGPPHRPAYDVEVRAHRSPPHQLTCRGRSRASAVSYEVTSITAV
ncbi:sucrase ferredoxin [Streptomyces sp. NPDC048182]|uniref:sucrase ferredoxin n=1 Tax=Streptomyces sp. NPDC048182 TaxID=3365507 RepID=UPI0037151F87